MAGVTNESKKLEIVETLAEEFPASAGIDIPMFFIDCFDINMPYDTTRNEVIRLVKMAQDSAYYYDTKLMRRCACLNWEAY